MSTRARILALLSRQWADGGRTLSLREIAEALGIAYTATRYHLLMLAGEGFLGVGERRGLSRSYRVLRPLLPRVRGGRVEGYYAPVNHPWGIPMEVTP